MTSSKRLVARVRTGVVVGTMTLLGVSAALSIPTERPAPATSARDVALSAGETVAAETPVRLAQANLWAGMGASTLAADVATVTADRPDFITYNEVDGRQDTSLAPAPYTIFRAAAVGNRDVDRYTRETAVAWDSTKWSTLATGTWEISHASGKYDWQNREWGIRYANWATLTNAEGRIVSVVSVHVAPDIAMTSTDGILEPSLRSLGALADILDDRGPVMIGGDLNVNYWERAKYPRPLMAELALTPTYDALGTWLPTGDEKGATIDYVLMRQASQFSVKQHYIRELNSDHKLLVADTSVLTNKVGYWAPGIMVNDPVHDPQRIAWNIALAIDGMPAGSTVHFTGRTLYASPVVAALKRAKARGVYLQLIFGDPTPTRAIRSFQRMLGTNVYKKNWAVNKPRRYTRFQLPAAHLLASESHGTPGLRLDVDRSIAPESYSQRMTMYMYTDQMSYDLAFRRFFAAAGRPL
jgi:hypothetical protein